MLPNQSFIPCVTSVQVVKSNTTFPHSVPDPLLVNSQMHRFCTVQRWIISTIKHLYESYISGELCRCGSIYRFPVCNFTLCCSPYRSGNKTPSGFTYSVAQLQVHALPGSPRVVVSSAAPGWPLRASSALRLHRAPGNTRLGWPSELGCAVPPRREPASWCLGQLCFTFSYLFHIFFYFKGEGGKYYLNGLAASCFQHSFFMSEFT